MLYTIFVLFIGIYIGQEYPSVPPIKTLAINASVALQRFSQTSQDNTLSKTQGVLEMVYAKLPWFSGNTKTE